MSTEKDREFMRSYISEREDEFELGIGLNDIREAIQAGIQHARQGERKIKTQCEMIIQKHIENVKEARKDNAGLGKLEIVLKMILAEIESL